MIEEGKQWSEDNQIKRKIDSVPLNVMTHQNDRYLHNSARLQHLFEINTELETVIDVALSASTIWRLFCTKDYTQASLLCKQWPRFCAACSSRSGQLSSSLPCFCKCWHVKYVSLKVFVVSIGLMGRSWLRVLSEIWLKLTQSHRLMLLITELSLAQYILQRFIELDYVP